MNDNIHHIRLELLRLGTHDVFSGRDPVKVAEGLEKFVFKEEREPQTEEPTASLDRDAEERCEDPNCAICRTTIETDDDLPPELREQIAKMMNELFPGQIVPVVVVRDKRA